MPQSAPRSRSTPEHEFTSAFPSQTTSALPQFSPSPPSSASLPHEDLFSPPSGTEEQLIRTNSHNTPAADASAESDDSDGSSVIMLEVRKPRRSGSSVVKVEDDDAAVNKGKARAADGEANELFLPAPVKPRPRLPYEILRQIFHDFPDSNAEGGCTDLRSASLVCREWEPAASARVWTHVVLNSSTALRKFMNCSRASEKRADRAPLVRTLDLYIEDWMNAPDDFTLFVPRLRGLRALLVYDNYSRTGGYTLRGPSISTIVAFLASCPHLVELEIPPPTSGYAEEDLRRSDKIGQARDSEWQAYRNGLREADYEAYRLQRLSGSPNLSKTSEEDYDEGPVLAARCGFNLATVTESIGRLNILRIAGLWHSMDFDARLFANLLVRSVGAPLVELCLDTDVWQGRQSAGPHLGPGALPKLDILMISGPYYNLFASLISARPPLRCLTLCDKKISCRTLRDELDDPECLVPLLRACPTITHLEIYSHNGISYTALSLLHCASLSSLSSLFLSSSLCGPNLKFLHLNRARWADRDLLRSISETCPRLEFLGVPEMSITPDEVGFLKRGCPNLEEIEAHIPSPEYRILEEHGVTITPAREEPFP
ncbi:hypothetical protein BDK51DRAFT_37407 [Blyttiomyces helicus]|uniref:F-box domain-containing protein n=1 Tax=Blyttiomyces helicus TaxID=388810 RepID=A0A4P9W5H1_9FUNG|nr:hypothetical protein BDK51DRAFT_37407 [Blyttiomyces helicus]|eukprot:RKO87202.1 hypothetical protein BDK51DRAFT_37407 [Blyttiomyces helicus]